MMCLTRFSAPSVLVHGSLILAFVVQASAQDANQPIKLTFTSIDVPGAMYTVAWGINKAGDIVGNYGQNIDTDSNGFLYITGDFTYFDYPGATITAPQKINDSGLIVGQTGYDPVYGFLYDGSTFTTIIDGSDSATLALGINNAGLIVGGAGTLGVTRGFELRGQKFKNISPPPGGWTYVYATAINNLGEIVGWTSGSNLSGFLYKDGQFQTISYPGASQTELWGINDSGVIVGWYEKGPPYYFHGFALMNGRYLSFEYPGSTDSFATGINASGQIVGQYDSADNVYHGFVTSPIAAADFEWPGCCEVAAEDPGQ